MLIRIITTAFVGFAALLFATQNSFAQNAEFSASVREGCFPLTVTFDPVLKDAGTTYKWDFGNNNTSTDQKPSAIYTAPGSFDVTLTVNNTATRIKGSFIIVHDAPSVDFTFDKTTGCAPLQVKFKDQTSTASGEIRNWEWVFGDGGTSSQANPTYVFTVPGTRIVSLRVRNEFGCEKLKSSTTPIFVLGPTAKFISDKTAVCSLPAVFQFTNQSTGDNNLTYLWDFGDNTTSTETSPSHSYNRAGTFIVSLKVRDGNGCEQTVKSKVSAGTEGGVELKFSNDKICLDKEIDFDIGYDASNPPVSVLWNFGDGNTSILNDPSNKFTTAGTFTVTLDVKLLNNSCNSVVTKDIVVARPAVPSFSFKSDCDYKLTLTSTSQNASAIDWYVEDQPPITGNQIVSPTNFPGNINVRMVAFDAAGCSVEKEDVALVPPNPFAKFLPDIFQSCDNNVPQLAGCAPFTVNFQDKSTSVDAFTIKWEFGDNTTSIDKNPVHTFGKGLFQVTLTATNSKGCKDVSTQFVQVADQTPVADFEINKTVACAGEEISFTNKSTNSDFWCWDFGDKITEIGKDVVHKYLIPGVYTVKLTARNAGCIGQKVKVNIITIKDPEINFSWKKNCGDPHFLSLTDESKNYDAGTLSWDFGDGHSSNRPDTVVSYRYQSEGVYRLALTGTNASTGCTVTAFENIRVHDLTAAFDVNTDHPCSNAPLVFTDKSHAAIKWEWTIAGEKINTQNPETKIKAPGNYTASLTVTDSQGCIKSTAPLPITVIDMKGEFNFTATSTCDDLAVNFKYIQDAGSTVPTDYVWDFGDGTPTSSLKNAAHTYHDLGNYTVTLTLKNNNGTTCEFSKDNAIVFTNPEPGFQTTKTEFCPGDVVQIANTTRNAILFEWDYGDGRRSDFKSPQILYTNSGKYTIALFAKDSYGCERKLEKSDFVIIDKPTADFSVDNASSACPPFTAKFQDKSVTTIKDWQWNFGDGQNSVLKNPSNIYQKPGQFNVTLTVTDVNGCKDTKVANQFVSVGGPTGSFVFDGPSQCSNQTISFTATVQNTAKLKWDYGDGNVEESTKTKVFHHYGSVGTFAPALVLVDNNGCQTVADGTNFLQIRDTTAVSISISPLCIRTGEPFKLQGSSAKDDDIKGWTWYINDISQGTGNTYQPTIDEPGLYVVTGYAMNKFNCMSHATDTVRIQGPITTIPNVITPNGDGRNESFKMIGLENSVWNIDILNRWGTSVYHKTGYTGDWSGEDQPAGVYYFVLRNAICEEKDYKGFISIVR